MRLVQRLPISTLSRSTWIVARIRRPNVHGPRSWRSVYFASHSQAANYDNSHEPLLTLRIWRVSISSIDNTEVPFPRSNTSSSSVRRRCLPSVLGHGWDRKSSDAASSKQSRDGVRPAWSRQGKPSPKETPQRLRLLPSEQSAMLGWYAMSNVRKSRHAMCLQCLQPDRSTSRNQEQEDSRSSEQGWRVGATESKESWACRRRDDAKAEWCCPGSLQLRWHAPTVIRAPNTDGNESIMRTSERWHNSRSRYIGPFAARWWWFALGNAWLHGLLANLQRPRGILDIRGKTAPEYVQPCTDGETELCLQPRLLNSFSFTHVRYSSYGSRCFFVDLVFWIPSTSYDSSYLLELRELW